MAQERRSAPGAGPARANLASLIFSYGFRTFFLLAAIFSPLAIAAWLGVYSGTIAPISGYPPISGMPMRCSSVIPRRS